jgi:hypothetical protein
VDARGERLAFEARHHEVGATVGHEPAAEDGNVHITSVARGCAGLALFEAIIADRRVPAADRVAPTLSCSIQTKSS